MEKFFKLKEHGTDVRTEVMAGITTFMTMAYILAVNPGILSASGMDSGAVFTATALASAIGCLCMALFANLPFLRKMPSDFVIFPEKVLDNSGGVWYHNQARAG